MISEQELEDMMQNDVTEADQVRIEPMPEPVSLEVLERGHILKTMLWAHGNKALAARTLGITIKTLYTRLHAYGYTDIRHVERRSNGAS